eukprot:gene5619-5582_t
MATTQDTDTAVRGRTIIMVMPGLALAFTSAATALAAAVPTSDRWSLILTADPADNNSHASGQVPENFYILKALDAGSARPLPYPLRHCANSRRGTLSSHPVAVVTTGIGVAHAAACASELATLYGANISEVLFTGTAGTSPVRGGALNTQCLPREGAASGSASAIGDVCVSPYAFNWDAHRCWWNASAPSGGVCVQPTCGGADRSDQVLRPSAALSWEVVQAAAAMVMPKMNDTLAAYMN